MVKTILLIEDDTTLRESLEDLLKLEGYNVVTASDGLQGLHLAIDYIPNIILCDISMPKMDGYQVFNKMQENASLSSIPFIFLTAKAELQDIRTGMMLGAEDYITKPFDFDELKIVISRRLQKYEKLSEKFDSNFKTICENNFFGVFIAQEQQIIYSNKFFQNLMEYTREELLSVNVYSLIMKSDKEKFNIRYLRCINGIDASMNIELSLISKHHKITTVNLLGNISSIDGKVSLIAMVDITSNKETNARAFDIDEMVDYIVSNKELISKDSLNKIIKIDKPENKIHKEQVKIEEILSKREIEVLIAICKGNTNAKIAELLFISPRTVDGHRYNIMQKINAKNTAELMMFALKHNLIEVS